MTTGRINQVAAFLAHPPGHTHASKEASGHTGGVPAVRTVQAPPKQTPELVSTDRSAFHAERPTVPSFQSETRFRRLPFLESSLRVLPAHSSDKEATGLGRQNADPSGHPAGVAVPPAGRCRSRILNRGLRTGTDCSGSGLAISLHIVYRYKLLNRGCTLA